MQSKTLTLKKPALRPDAANPRPSPKKLRPEQTLTGKTVVVQGKSPSHWNGVVESFDGGWLVLNGEERRWLSDGSLSGVVCKGRFSIDRSAINYICEVVDAS